METFEKKNNLETNFNFNDLLFLKPKHEKHSQPGFRILTPGVPPK
jgi:hypothetical protein